jgi:histidinol dehydrogenase
LSNQLEQILISFRQEDFRERIRLLRLNTIKAAHWPEGSPSYDALAQIINGVRTQGDNALIEYTDKYDSVNLTANQLRISDKDLKEAHNQIDAELLQSLRGAIENVKKYQSEIFIGNKNTHPGIKYTPLERVGVCVPGASAPLPSTVIMTAVPAQVAGVKEIAVVSPPRYEGSVHPVILAVCYELGITEVYRVGGAQAVAALAYGTKTIKKVHKIVGPGNTWVQHAKRNVFGVFVDIDSIAGPSEVLIIANDSANPAWVAADMLSQAEHDPASAALFTDSQTLAEKVLDELQKQVQQLSRSEETLKCLMQFSGIVVFDSMNHAVETANDFASEHLQIQCETESRQIAEKIKNAGAIFIGEYSPVALGDYWAGPSHTLPTGTSAKFFSALTSNDFVKSISIIEYDKDKLTQSADDIIRLARAEGLDAHAKSVKLRTQN